MKRKRPRYHFLDDVDHYYLLRLAGKHRFRIRLSKEVIGALDFLRPLWKDSKIQARKLAMEMEPLVPELRPLVFDYIFSSRITAFSSLQTPFYSACFFNDTLLAILRGCMHIAGHAKRLTICAKDVALFKRLFQTQTYDLATPGEEADEGEEEEEEHEVGSGQGPSGPMGSLW